MFHIQVYSDTSSLSVVEASPGEIVISFFNGSSISCPLTLKGEYPYVIALRLKFEHIIEVCTDQYTAGMKDTFVVFSLGNSLDWISSLTL